MQSKNIMDFRTDRKAVDAWRIRLLITAVLGGLFFSPAFRAEAVFTRTGSIDQDCHSHLLNAMRSWNYVRFQDTLRAADRVGLIPEWRKEFGRNLLEGCERNAVLMTHNAADTLPLMYLQHIEKFRRDVAILPVTLLDKPWYVSLLKQDGRFVFNKPRIDLTLGEIIRLDREEILPDRFPYDIPGDARFPVPKEASRKTVLELSEWRPHRSDYSSGMIRIFLYLLAGNRGRRPVYVSSACDSFWMRQIRDRLRCEGLVHRVHPSGNPAHEQMHSWEKIARLLMNPDRFVHLRKARMETENAADAAYQAYSRLARGLLIRHHQEGTCQTTRHLITFFSENFGFSDIPAPPEQ